MGPDWIAHSSELFSALHADLTDVAPGQHAFNVGFRAHQDADQIIPNTTFTKLDFTRSDFNLGFHFSEVTDLFTAPADGIYEFVGSGRLKNLGDGKKIIVSLFLNGVRYSEGRTTVGGTDYVAVFVADRIELALNDTMGLYIFHNHGVTGLRTAGNEIAPSFFSGWRVG